MSDTPERDEPQRQKAHPAYLGLLGSQTLLLAVVGWFSIGTVNRVEAGIEKVVENGQKQSAQLSEQAQELAQVKATIDAWAKQNFVPRDLFDAMKAECERRIGALEKKG